MADQVEVDGRHLGRQDGMGLFAVVGKMRTLCHDDGLVVRYMPPAQHRQQRAQTDPRRAQIADFVQLDHGVEALVPFRDLPHLVGGDGVQPAAEGAELDQVDRPMGRREAGRMVKPGVVAPLVHDGQLVFGRVHMVDGIFRDDGQVVGLDHLRDAVVDLRVQMVGPAHQQDHRQILFFRNL